MKNEKAKQQRYDLCTKYLSELSSAGSLMELLELHKRMWKEGIQHNNIGPNEYGMFRTKDIASMEPSEVFLGISMAYGQLRSVTGSVQGMSAS